MTIPTPVHPRPRPRSRHLVACACGAIILASLAALSAHGVRGLQTGALALAFVSSPLAGGDALVPITWSNTTSTLDTGLRVMCFFVANPSPPRLDLPDWPRITGVGLELPGAPSGFALIDPLDGNWELAHGVKASLPDHGKVTLDFAIRARAKPSGHMRQPLTLRGIPPGQPNNTRGVGTRFCVSGPFPDVLPNLATPETDDVIPATVEALLNGVVVGFHGVDDGGNGVDAGVWAPAPPATRPIPMYP